MIFSPTYIRSTVRYSAFKVANLDSFPFEPADYSKFKYGSTTIARNFGHHLADEFIDNILTLSYTGSPIVVLSSAYSHIPTASYFMSIHFIDRLNEFMFMRNFPPVEIAKINRSVTYREDYGNMSADERYNLIKNDRFHIDASFLKGKTLIFIDDIKITGTHERIIEKMLDEYGITNDCYLLYLAELSNPDLCPSTENYLNHSFVKKLSDLMNVVNQSDFEFNTRVVKFILNSQTDECMQFLKQQTESFLESLYYKALGNEYYKFPEYLTNLMMLKNMLNSN